MRRISSMLLAVLLLSSAGAQAAPRISEALDREPPAPLYEATPSERPGYVWTPGCWKWDGKRMVWSFGRWIAKRPGYDWVPDGWEKRADKWYFAEGYWQANEWLETPEPAAAVQPPEEEDSSTSPAPVVSAAVKHKNLKKRTPKPIDYNDPKKWPRVIQH